MVLWRIFCSRLMHETAIFDTLDSIACHIWECPRCKHLHPAATSAEDFLSEEAGVRTMFTRGKLLGETIRYMARIWQLMSLLWFLWGSTLYARVHQMGVLYFDIRQLTRRFSYSTGTTLRAAIHVSGYDLPGLWARRDYLEMWQSCWSHCCFWLGF